MRIISLFSGAGGLDLGLIQAGNEVIWANDIDKDAVATYSENIGQHIVCDDIKNIDINEFKFCLNEALSSFHLSFGLFKSK